MHARLLHVTLKLAQTLDGRIATASGHSRWVTGARSRAVAHDLRASHDAVLVGIGTVVADNPQLSVRPPRGDNPMRVIVDSTLRLSPKAAVLARDGAKIVIVTLASSEGERAHALQRAGADVLTVPSFGGRVDLTAALSAIEERGVRSVLIEGGAQIATETIRRRLMHELVVFIAPKILGSGLDSVGDLGITDMQHALQFEPTSIEVRDGDILFRGTPIWQPENP